TPGQRRVAWAMKAGSPDVIAVETQDLPPLQADQALVRVEAVLNCFKHWQRLEDAVKMLAESVAPLFVAQPDDRVDGRGSPRRHIAGDDCDQRQKDNDSRKTQRIGWRDVIERRLNHASDAEGARESEHLTNSGKRDALSHDQAKHIASARAERHAHAHLLG